MAAIPPFPDATRPSTKMIGIIYNKDATASCPKIWVDLTPTAATYDLNEAPEEEPKKKKEPNPFIENRKKRTLERWQR